MASNSCRDPFKNLLRWCAESSAATRARVSCLSASRSLHLAGGVSLHAPLCSLRHTPCFTEQERPLDKCAQDPEAMKQCQHEYDLYQQCRQGLLDPRNRIRGNKALR